MLNNLDRRDFWNHKTTATRRKVGAEKVIFLDANILAAGIFFAIDVPDL